MKVLRHVGLDVHAQSISVAVADESGTRSLGKIPHDIARLKRLLKKLGKPGELKIVYEAGPTGFGLCRELRTAKYSCDIIAPTLVPQQPGERVKTDRRDAQKLAYFSLAGLLQPIWVPGPAQEALRDLVRARESAKACSKKAGQRLDKFLLRHGRRPQEKMSKWTQKHLTWIRSQRFDHELKQLAFEEYLAELDHQRERVKRLESALHEAAENLSAEQQAVVRALMALKGIRFLSAVTIVSEIGDMYRFSHPTQLMSYAGLVPREHSSGESVRRGAITKSGNAHLRRIVGESAQSLVRGLSTPSRDMKIRRKGLSAGVITIAEKADKRLHARFRRLTARGKPRNKAVTAVARELLGFIWAVAIEAQQEQNRQSTEAA